MKSTATPFRRGARAASALAGLLAIGLSASQAAAQPLRPQPAAPAAAQPAPAAGQQAPAAGQQAQPGGALALPERGPDPLAAALAPHPGGLTPDEVARAAVLAQASLRVKQAELQAAAARVDQALVNYFPRVTLTASYTRLSEVENSLGSGAALVFANNPGGLVVGPCPPGAPVGVQCVVDSQGQPAGAAPLDFPVLNNSYSLVANLTVPISDYVLRLSQNYAAQSRAESAKKLEVAAQALQIGADAKIAFYNWVRAKGQAIVAHEAVEQAKAHLADARRTFDVGLISRADVLRLESQVASAEQVETEANAFLEVADEQLRTSMALPAGKPMEIGIDVMGAPSAPPAGTLQALQQEAFSKRLEIRALDETVFSLKETESVLRAGYYPRLDAFANLNYSNPNPRIFPAQDKFEMTWDAGLRLTWTINDTFTAMGATAEARARTLAVEEQKSVLRSGLRVEVASAYADVRKAAGNIEASERQLAASEESMRVRSELFRAGRATSVDLVDAETEVTRARLKQIDARVGLLVAQMRLEHSTGRDVK